jgi:hypothetical protein
MLLRKAALSSSVKLYFLERTVFPFPDLPPHVVAAVMAVSEHDEESGALSYQSERQMYV